MHAFDKRCSVCKREIKRIIAPAISPGEEKCIPLIIETWDSSNIDGDCTVKLTRVDPLILSKEEMDQLYFDHRPVRHYCLQCRGPKYMIPSEKVMIRDAELVGTKAPSKYAVVCKSCRTKYTAKVAPE